MFRIGVQVVAHDLGMRGYVDRFYTLNKSYTKVGFPDEAKVGEATKTGSGHKAYPDMEEVAYIASIHEFGAPARNIPQRSFFRPAIDENIEKLGQLQASRLRAVLDGAITVREGLSAIGEFVVAKVKDRIRTEQYAPLKPATIARKGSDKPLIDSAQMINSVTHVEVVG